MKNCESEMSANAQVCRVSHRREVNARTIMMFHRALLYSSVLLTFSPVQRLMAQGQRGPSGVPTLQVTSTLVFLDVTVLDKQRHPVTTGLTKDDFTITEDKKQERIFSFEAPESHVMGANAGDNNPD